MQPDPQQVPLGKTAVGRQPDFRNDVEKESSPLSVFQDNEDGGIAEHLAEEFVNLSGAWVVVKVRTDSNAYDDVWDEDVDPTYKNGFKTKAFFKTEPLQEELTKWGVDTPNKATVVFPRAVIYRKFGERMLRAGDLIDVPYGAIANSPKQYRITNVSETGNFKYRWLYLSCDAVAVSGDVTIRKENF
jgi:hypothetical protein